MKNYFKNLLVISTFFLTLLITSCNKDEDNGASYSFKDQNLQGLIEGIAFDFKDGTASEGFEEGELFIKLINETEPSEEACEAFGTEKVNVIFSIPNQVGIYELSFSFSGSSNQTVSLVDNESDEIPLTVVATLGAVEILSISENQITGRMDARADGSSFVNGNFTADFCQ